VSRPANRATYRKRGGKHRPRQTGQLEHNPGPELDIGNDSLIGFPLRQIGQDLLFDAGGPFDQLTAERLGRCSQDNSSRVLGAVNRMTKPHNLFTIGNGVGDPIARRVRPADLVDHLDATARRSPMQRTSKSPDRGDDRTGHVGTGASRDAGGERRRIEPVIDRCNQVLLDSSGGYDVGHGAGRHPQIVGRVAQRRFGIDWVEPQPATMMTSQDVGHDRRQTDGIVTQLLGGTVDRRTSAFAIGYGQDTNPQRVHRIRETFGRRVDQPPNARRQLPITADLDQRSLRRQGPVDLKSPDVFEGSLTSELGRVELAIVKETFLASHRTQNRVGNGKAFKTGRGDKRRISHVSTVHRMRYIDNLDRINVDPINMSVSRISAAEAAARLGVKRETIYAYVSRGQLSSERHIDGKSSTFDPLEIDRLRRRKNDSRPGRLEVAISSGITEVLDGSVAYRGHRLESLIADGASFEAVAELLWSGNLGPTQPWSASQSLVEAVSPAIQALSERSTSIDRMMAGVVAAAAADPFRADRSRHGLTTSGRILVCTIIQALPAAGPRHDPPNSRVADRLWNRLTTTDPAGADLLDRALVVLADHGMATSTLAARLAASTRAAPHAVLLAGLGAVSGPLHGAASAAVHDLLVHAESDGADAAIAAVIERDGKVPGIGHFIHRQADPRHDLLMEAIANAAATFSTEQLDVVASVVARTSQRIPVAPNVDFALGALTYLSNMSRDAGEVVFAIARTAGWLAHALEEYDEAPIRFRPVGRYVAERRSSSTASN